MSKKTIVVCSGGIDSIGMLWKILTETDDEVLVQHIKIKDIHNYWIHENSAFNNAMAFLKKCMRPFTILPTMEYSGPYNAPHRYVTMLAGALAAYNNDATRVVKGKVNVDYSLPTNPKNVRCKEIYDIILSEKNVLYETPVKNVDKRSWFTLLPSELIEMLVTCRAPLVINDEFVECGVCYSCVRYNEAQKGLDPIPPSQLKIPIPRTTIDTEIRELNGEAVLFFPTLNYDNINYLHYLLENTDKTILYQPLDVPNVEPLISDFVYYDKIIDNFIKSTNRIKKLPIVKFDTKIKLDKKTVELVRFFCAGTAASLYRFHVNEALVTLSDDNALNEQSYKMFNTTKLYPTDYSTNEHIVSTLSNIPTLSKNYINSSALINYIIAISNR